ncbi:Sec-independent protein translocase subunit TatA [Crossiella sp. CA-258035]|uniref:Sec-independent protein translocase subunit TatA n=1 Tax=Crossiella sp. CA-258035 TaxID=2981138 RepID=UPI0024BCF719|nr:Sec-independent protein translocase subunit TatA [Crossiella sp. CA-258035]WHT16827.1 Sec-independent protein translocase subunit TatA [Crossiella sp. CA-258035]
MPIGVPELLIIAVVVVLLFGAKKMPDMARAVGRSMRIFKAETKTMREEDGQAEQAAAPAPQPPVQQQPAAQQPYTAAPQPLPPTQPVVQQPAPQVAPPLEQTQGRADNR